MRFAVTLLGALLGLGILLSLGTWQVQRLHWKEGVIAEREARLFGSPEPLPAEPNPAADAFMPVRVAGTVGDEALRVLASDKRLGAIWRVVSPMETEDGRRVLLDRGAIPAMREDVPAGGRATVTGNLHWPDERDGWTPADDLDGNVWYARDVARMAEALGTEPVMVVAREVTLPSGAELTVTPLPPNTSDIPNDHLGYAITWFGLAAAWAAMAAALLLRERREGTA